MSKAESPIRLLLVDDHPLVIDGISARLKNEPNLTVIGTANNGKDALQQAKQITPDVVLMDVTMPVMGGLEATLLFKTELPDIKVLIFSMHDDHEYIVKLMKAGAYGYLLKDVSSDELIKAIEAVHQGSTYFSAGASQSLFSDQPEKDPTTKATVLTKREEAVLKQIADGQCNKNIARALDISVRTVETHRLNIKHKLNVSTAAGLTRYALEHNLIKLP
jgi:two-component system nitrate/nitrite response regulator NarL